MYGCTFRALSRFIEWERPLQQIGLLLDSQICEGAPLFSLGELSVSLSHTTKRATSEKLEADGVSMLHTGWYPSKRQLRLAIARVRM